MFSTHDMGAAEKLCDRIFMIFKGHKVLDGSLDAIQPQYGHDTVRVRLGGGAAALDGVAGSRVGQRPRQLPGCAARRAIRRRSCAQLVETDAGACSSRSRKPSLHDIFVRIARPTLEELQPAGEVA